VHQKVTKQLKADKGSWGGVFSRLWRIKGGRDRLHGFVCSFLSKIGFVHAEYARKWCGIITIAQWQFLSKPTTIIILASYTFSPVYD
jgi:hypothetical protein